MGVLEDAYDTVAGGADWVGGDTDEAVGRFTSSGDLSELTPTHMAPGLTINEYFTEWMPRAMGGGIINVSDGTNALTDDGDLYGGDYSGSTNAFESLTTGGNVVLNNAGDLASQIPDMALDITPTWMKVAIFLLISGVFLYLVRPILGIIDASMG